ncbi:MAG: hypothetical protein ACKOB4_05105 [Acidobacteriota bacterium]
MKYLICIFTFLLAAGQPGLGQTPLKRPVKNPPQYPNIIDLEDSQKPAAQAAQGEKPSGEKKAAPGGPAGPDREDAAALQTAALLKAVESLAGEMRSLVQEIRAMNIRQQTQLDITRISGLGARIDALNGELRTIRDRLATLSVDEQNISLLMTRESLLSQSFNIGTLDRERTMEQLRNQHEAKLRYVQADKERLQRTESDLAGQLQYYQTLQDEAEKRIQAAESLIRRLEESRESAAEPKRQP